MQVTALWDNNTVAVMKEHRHERVIASFGRYSRQPFRPGCEQVSTSQPVTVGTPSDLGAALGVTSLKAPAKSVGGKDTSSFSVHFNNHLRSHRRSNLDSMMMKSS